MAAQTTCPWCSAILRDRPDCPACGAVVDGAADDARIPGVTLPDLTEAARIRARTEPAHAAGRALTGLGDTGRFLGAIGDAGGILGSVLRWLARLPGQG